MNSEGKKAALGAEQYRLERISVLPIATLDKMYAGGATNLWDGLKLGMDAIKDRKGAPHLFCKIGMAYSPQVAMKRRQFFY